MSQCYVCLEACDEKSPCECEMAVHKECLSDVCRKIRTKDCTVCKSPIRIEYINIEIDPPSVLEMHEAVTFCENNCCVCICLNLCIFLMYLVSGWVGKFVLFILGYKTNAWCFWCIDHLLAAVGVIAVSLVVLSLLPTPNRI